MASKKATECTRKLGCKCADCSAFADFAPKQTLSFKATHQVSSPSEGVEEGDENRGSSTESPKSAQSLQVNDIIPEHEIFAAVTMGEEAVEASPPLAVEPRASPQPESTSAMPAACAQTTPVNADTTVHYQDVEDLPALVGNEDDVTSGGITAPLRSNPVETSVAAGSGAPESGDNGNITTDNSTEFVETINTAPQPGDRPLKGTGSYKFDLSEYPAGDAPAPASPHLEKVRARKAAAAARKSLLSPQMRKSMMPSAVAAALALAAASEGGEERPLAAHLSRANPLSATSLDSDAAFSTASTDTNAAAVDAFSTTPLDERLMHKNVNARKSGMQELLQLLTSGGAVDPAVADVLRCNSVIEKCMSESSIQLVELGTLVCQAVLGNPTLRPMLKGSAVQLTSIIISKVFAINKSHVFNAAVGVTQQLARLDGVPAPLVEALLAGYKNTRNKRACAGCCRAIAGLVRGPAFRSHFSTLAGILPALLQGNERSQREAAVALCEELAKQQPDLIVEIVKKFPTALPSEAVEKMFPHGLDAPLEAVAEVDTAEDDDDATKDAAYADAAPVDVTKDIEKLKIESVLAKDGKAWAEKVAVMDAAAQIFSKHAKVAGDGSDLVHTIKQCLTNESNANVQAAAISLATAMSKSLRERFGLARILVPIVLDKLREKKGRGLTAAQDAVFAFTRYACISFDNIVAAVTSAFSPVVSASVKTSSAEQKVNLLHVLVDILESKQAFKTELISGAPTNGISPNARITSLVAWLGPIITDSGSDAVRYEAERVFGALVRRISELSPEDPQQAAQHPKLQAFLEPLSVKNQAAHFRILLAAGLADERLAPAGALLGGAGKKAAKIVMEPVVTSAAPENKAPVVAKSKGASVAATMVKAAPPAIPGKAESGPKPSSAPVAADLDASLALEAGDVPSGGDVLSQLQTAELVISGLNLDEVAAPSAEAAAGAGDAESETLERPPELALNDMQKLEKLVRGSTKDWQAKKSALEVLAKCLPIQTQVSMEAATVLAAHGFDTAQHAVAGAAAGLLTNLAASCTVPGLFTRRSAAFVVSRSAIWLKEKAKKQLILDLQALYMTLASIVGPNLILHYLQQCAMSNPKLPALTEKVNEIAASMISTFGYHRVAVQPLLAFACTPATGIQSATAPIKASAKLVLAALHKQMGKTLESLLSKKVFGLDEKVQETLRKDFDSLPFDAAEAATILSSTKPVLGEKLVVPPIGASAGTTSAVASSLASLFEKGDILTLIPKTALIDIDTPNTSATAAPSGGAGQKEGGEDSVKPWQIRLEAIEAIIAAVSKAIPVGGVVMNENVGTVLKALSRRLADSNANLRPKAIVAIGLLAKACGPSISSYFKVIVRSLIDQLSDKRCQKPAMETLDACIRDPADGSLVQANFAALVASIGNPSEVAIKDAMREELFSWLARHSAEVVRSSTTLGPFQNQQLYKYTIDALLEKTPVVRQHANAFLVHAIRIAGSSAVMSAVSHVSSATARDSLTACVRNASESAKSLSSVEPAAVVDMEFTSGPAKTAATAMPSKMLPPPVPNRTQPVARGSTSTTSRVERSSTLGRKSATSSTMSERASTAGGPPKEYLLATGAPLARDHRNRLSNRSKWLVSSDTLSGASAAVFVKSLTTEVMEEWRAAMVASKSLLDDLFATGDTAATRFEAALAWLTASVMECMNGTNAPGRCSVESITANADLILKYVAISLMDVKEKPSVISASLSVLEAMVSLFSQFDFPLLRCEADVIMPVLCEKSGHKREETRGRYIAVIESLMLIFATNRTSQGYPEGISGPLEGYVIPACAMTKNTTTRVALLTIVKQTIEREKNHRVLKRPAYQTIAKFLVEPKAVQETREAALGVFSAVFLVLQCNSMLFYKLLSSDDKGLSGRSVAGLDPRAYDMISMRLQSVLKSKPEAELRMASATRGAEGSAVERPRPSADHRAGAVEFPSIDPFDESIPAPPTGAYEAADPKTRSSPVAESLADENTSDDGSVSSLRLREPGTASVLREQQTIVEPHTKSSKPTELVIVEHEAIPVAGQNVLSLISGGYNNVDSQLSATCPQYVRTFLRTLISQARVHLAQLNVGGMDVLNRISATTSYKAARTSIDEVMGLVCDVPEVPGGRGRIPADVFEPIAQNADAFFAVCRAAIHAAYGGLSYPANRSKHSTVKVDEDYAARVLRIMSELMTYTGGPITLNLSQPEVEAVVRELLTRCFDCRATKATANAVSGTLLRSIYRLRREYIVISVLHLMRPAGCWTPPSGGDFKADDASVPLPVSPHEISALVSTIIKTAWTETSAHHVFRDVATPAVLKALNEMLECNEDSRLRAAAIAFEDPLMEEHGAAPRLRGLPGLNSTQHAAMLRSIADAIGLNPTYATYVLSPIFGTVEFFKVLTTFLGLDVQRLMDEAEISESSFLRQLFKAVINEMAAEQGVTSNAVSPKLPLSEEEANSTASRLSQRAERSTTSAATPGAGLRTRRVISEDAPTTPPRAAERHGAAGAEGGSTSVPATPFQAMLTRAAGSPPMQAKDRGIGEAAAAQIQAASLALSRERDTAGERDAHFEVPGGSSLAAEDSTATIMSRLAEIKEIMSNDTIQAAKSAVAELCEISIKHAPMQGLEDPITRQILQMVTSLPQTRRQVVWTNMNLCFLRCKLRHECFLPRLILQNKAVPTMEMIELMSAAASKTALAKMGGDMESFDNTEP